MIGEKICYFGISMAGEGYVDVAFEVTEEAENKFLAYVKNICQLVILICLLWTFVVIVF